MTSREKQVCTVIEALGGVAHPTEIGRTMGVSGDYAEQLCRDLVWHGMLVKNGLKYALA